MNFSDFVIDAEDFDFYESLPADQRILFLYDLICEESYGHGSTVATPTETITENIQDDMKFSVEAFLSEFEAKISSIIERSIKNSAKSNLAFLNTIIVINSDYKKEIALAVIDLLEQGLIVTKQPMTERMTRVFHKQKYCAVYKIIGHGQAISLN